MKLGYYKQQTASRTFNSIQFDSMAQHRMKREIIRKVNWSDFSFKFTMIRCRRVSFLLNVANWMRRARSCSFYLYENWMQLRKIFNVNRWFHCTMTHLDIYIIAMNSSGNHFIFFHSSTLWKIKPTKWVCIWRFCSILTAVREWHELKNEQKVTTQHSNGNWNCLPKGGIWSEATRIQPLIIAFTFRAYNTFISLCLYL